MSEYTHVTEWEKITDYCIACGDDIDTPGTEYPVCNICGFVYCDWCMENNICEGCR